MIVELEGFATLRHPFTNVDVTGGMCSLEENVKVLFCIKEFLELNTIRMNTLKALKAFNAKLKIFKTMSIRDFFPETELH